MTLQKTILITSLSILILILACLNQVEEPYKYPDLTGSLDLSQKGYLNSITTLGDRAYISAYNGSNGIVIVCDISSLTSPKYVKSLSLSSFRTIPPTSDIIPYNDYCITVDTGGNTGGYIYFCYVNPFLEKIKVESDLIDTSSELQAIDIENDLIYITGFHPTEGGKLYILDASTIPNPDILYSDAFSENGGYSILVENNIIYIGSYTNANGLERTGRVYIYDGTDPTNPQLIGTYDCPGNWGWVLDMDISDDYLYLANWRDGVEIVDVSDPSNPHHISTYEYDYAINSVGVKGDYLSVCGGWGGFFLLDVSDKSNPFKIGYTIEPTYGNFTDLYIDGSYAFLVDSGKHRLYITQIVD